ncbi:MAG: glycosyltransferase [Alphaproteobacteria bacterium]|nr:glycosyltransferase [Alphaproteobacteria bacterium]
MLTVLAFLSLLGWLYLGFYHGDFWRPLVMEEDSWSGPWPNIDIVVPARNEEDVIGATLSSLLTQNYPGYFRVILVNDHSTDTTRKVAEETAIKLGQSARLTIVDAPDLPKEWSGKVAAMQAGVRQSSSPFILFTDADIVHHPKSLEHLVAKAELNQLDLTSLMVKLYCESWAEKLMIPAFVFFFAMLYPFRRANDPRSRVAAAAGGVMLVRRVVLDEAGGLEKIKNALIDDCSLAALIKKCSNRIYLGLTHDVRSIRPYHTMDEIHNMIARAAYTQLHYSPLYLLGCLLGLSLLFLVPLVALLSFKTSPLMLGLFVLYEIFILYRPTIRFYGRSLAWAASLPLAALFYMIATIDSALRYYRGKGGNWKGRYQTSKK